MEIQKYTLFSIKRQFVVNELLMREMPKTRNYSNNNFLFSIPRISEVITWKLSFLMKSDLFFFLFYVDIGSIMSRILSHIDTRLLKELNYESWRYKLFIIDQFM